MVHTVPYHKAYNQLPPELLKLPSLKPRDIFNLFLNKSVLEHLVSNTNKYAEKHYQGLDVTAHDWALLFLVAGLMCWRFRGYP